MSRVFISYRSESPDKEVAAEFSKQLRAAGHEVFMASESINWGEKWSERIRQELKIADYFLVLLSQKSIMSDMVTEEIKEAKELFDRVGAPKLLPIRIRLSMDQNDNYDIAGYLNSFQQRFWATKEDTSVLVGELSNLMKADSDNVRPGTAADLRKQAQQQTVDQTIPVPNAPLINPGGTVAMDSPYYVKRRFEDEYIEQVTRPGTLLRIKGPRQFGKTSLLTRIMLRADQAGQVVVSLSCQQLDIQSIQSMDRLLQRLCRLTTRKLGLPNRIKEFWEDDFLDTKMKCNEYFEDYLLAESDKDILIAIDEADRIFDFPQVSHDFFGMLRFWHESAKFNPLWKKVHLAISYSTEAYLAIEDINQSPFNVGDERPMEEFTGPQVQGLAVRHGLNLSEEQLRLLTEMIGGHPFLVRKALYVMAHDGVDFWDLIESAPTDEGPFGDHLRRHQWVLNQQPECLKALYEVIRSNYLMDQNMANRLRAVGLIKGSIPNIQPRFRIYSDYFKRIGKAMAWES